MPSGRPPLIKGTEWQTLVDRLIAVGWSSASISLYLKTRFKHEVASSTVRVYRLDHEKRIKEEYPHLAATGQELAFQLAKFKSDEFVDAVGLLGELILMQRDRIEVDLRVEGSFSKLLPDTRHELRLLGDLLLQYHQMLQDWGVAPKAGLEVFVQTGLPTEAEAISAPLVEILDEEELDDVISLSRRISERAKQNQLSTRAT